MEVGGHIYFKVLSEHSKR